MSRILAPPGKVVERPSYEQLLADPSEMRWVAVGAKYGVFDNAVRKWFRRYLRKGTDAEALSA
jgi:uncharacterized protein YjcR